MMDNHEQIFEPIFKEMEMYFPFLVEQMVDWYPSGQMEVTVKLRDGRKIAYSSITKGIRTVRDLNETLDDVDEEHWRDAFRIRLYKKLYMTNMTQEDLAEKSGVSSRMISRYMLGRATPSGHTIYRLAKALGCTVSELTDF